MVAVCIAGMHRSGTSMVTALLQRRGLYLGPDKALMGATVDNPFGYRENLGFVEINKAILRRHGANWDTLPVPLVSAGSGLRDWWLRRRARALLRGFEGRPAWGWKDPRTSLTLPFWNDLIADLQVVICLRDPAEVERSLRGRRHGSIRHGAALWEAYNRRLLEVAPRERRIITHYDAYFRDPVAELDRVATFLGLDRVDGGADIADLIRGGLRTYRPRASPDGTAAHGRLYEAMCEEAGYLPGA